MGRRTDTHAFFVRKQNLKLLILRLNHGVSRRQNETTMSQNKTVIQGLEPAEEKGYNTGVNPNFYSRNAHAELRGTVVPGMVGNVEQKQVFSRQPQSSTSSSNKPVVGFLYSVSRDSVGEYWPLHIGQNSIGQNPQSDIVLSEGTVSSDHAILVVRKMKNPEKVIASISDARSTNGTMINGESIGFSAVECKNGDIITIGDNYELYLILIDTFALGLKVQEDFIPVSSSEMSAIGTQQGPMPGYTRPFEDTQSSGAPIAPQFDGGYVPSPGTVGFDGIMTGDKGGTVGI